MARSIRRAFTAGTAITIAVSAAWAYTTMLTSAGPAPVPHLARSLPADCWQLTAGVTGSGPELAAVTAAIYTACFTVAAYRRRPR